MKRLPAYLRPFWLVLIVALGCDSGSAPSAGNLTVRVLGVPSGSSAVITVSGPGGFSQPVTATQTFTQLPPGSYTIAATSITVGPSEYAPSPPSQTIAVNGNANASVLYALATGNLAVTITGLGTASSAAVTVTGPNSYTQDVATSTTLFGLTPGSYTVTARDTTATGGTSETASPNSQPVSVQARQTASANVTYTPPPINPAQLNLRIAGMYLTQSAQNYAGSVPLVRGRNGYLRVFVVASNTNTAAPDVRVRFFNGVLPFDSTLILSPGLATPTTVDESSLSYSWNFSVPGSWIQQGLAISAEVDPANAVLETNEGDNLFPAVGPLAMDVRIVPALDVVFVPILQKGIPLSRRVKGNVTTANKDQFLQTTQQMHPIETYNATVHADYTTFTLDTLQADNGNGAWGRILGEIDAVRLTEHSPKYYYGVAKVSYTSGVAGVAFVSTSGPSVGSGARAALGWDWLPSGGTVAAHELGHNWGRNHAPCGGPAGVDPNYPHSDGSTGTYGVDITVDTLAPSTDSDIMGYCPKKWISDYTYKGVLTYLLNPSPPATGIASQSVQPSLLVWGHIRNGEVVLEPAFQVTTRPSLPEQPGPYTLEGRADDGSTLFALSFSPTEVADAGTDQQNFAFAIPLPASRAAHLSSIRVAGRGREALALGQATGASDSATVRRLGGGRVALRWNASAHPVVMVRDAATGQVLSLARGGDVEFSTTKSQLDLVFSNGVRSHLKRVQVTR